MDNPILAERLVYNLLPINVFWDIGCLLTLVVLTYFEFQMKNPCAFICPGDYNFWSRTDSDIALYN